MTAVASLANVSKRFGKTHALERVGFGVSAGTTVALLGANGAGKTTAISLLLGLRRPDAGTVELFGRDPRHPETRRRLGCTPQDAAFPTTLRVGEIVAHVAAHFERPAPAAALLSRFGLERLRDRQTGGLSGGERRRLACALAFAGSPELVVLDEPTTGLDPDARAATWRALGEHVDAGGSILLTTHYLEEAEALADAVVVLDRGRVVSSGDVASIRAGAGGGRVTFRTERLPPLDLGDVREDGSLTTIDTPDPTATVRALVLAGARLEGLEVRPLPLEEALRRLRVESP